MTSFGNREKNRKPRREKPAVTFAKVSCQLFGNLLAALERAAPEAQPDYAVTLRYTVAIIALNYHSRNISSSNVPAVIAEANQSTARSIAHSLDNEARIDDRADFYDRYMSVGPEDLADEIESLVLDMVTGKDSATVPLARRIADEAFGGETILTSEAFDEFAQTIEDRIIIASRVVMKNL